MARTTGRCARKKKPGAPAPLHTLQGLRALARIESPGGAPDFFFFFGTKKKKKFLNPLYPFSQKNSVQSVQALQYPVYHPLSSASYIPPPLYQPL